MKRILSFLILIVLVAGLLAACGQSEGGPTGGGTGAATTAPGGGTGAATTAPGGGTGAATTAPGGGAATTAPAEATPTTAAAAEATPTTAAAGEPPAPTEEPPVTLGSGGERVVIWHGWAGSYYQEIERLLGEFATANNMTLELVRVTDMNEKVNVAIPAGEGPDIIAWVNDQIGKNVELGVIQPLDDKGIDRAYLEQNFVETAVQAVTYSEQTWCVPESMEAIAFVYNKALVQEADLPKDTNELLQKAQEFNTANQGSYYFVYQAAPGDPYHSAPWWYGHGASYVDEEGEVGLDSPESIQAGQFLKQLTTVMPREVDYDVSKALMTEGKAAIWLTGPWAVSDLQAANIDIGVAPIPTISATGQPGSPFVGVKCMMLAEGAQSPDASIKLMQYYGSAEFQSALAEVNKQVPANKQAQDAVKDDPIVAGFLASANNGVPLPSTPFMAVLWGPATDAQKAIWTGTQEPEQALQDAAQIARQNVEQIK